MGGAVACGVWRVARSLIQHSTPSGATSVLANIEITEEGVGTGASPMVAANIVKLSVKVLRNLLVCRQDLYERVLSVDGIPVLVKHMKTTEDMDTCVQCAKICYVLATVPDTSVIANLVDGGIMSGLSAMCATLTDAQRPAAD